MLNSKGKVIYICRITKISNHVFNSFFGYELINEILEMQFTFEKSKQIALKMFLILLSVYLMKKVIIFGKIKYLGSLKYLIVHC